MPKILLFLDNGGSFLTYISQPWHWSVSGLMISLILFLLVWMGKSFGVSSSFKALCTLAGAGKKVSYFNYDLKNEYWRLSFVAGALIGGYLAFNYLQSPHAVDISDSTIQYLSGLGLSYPQSDATGQGFLPTQIFNFGSAKGILLALFGGVLIGFGTRYGNGCTSGHAITGLAHFQLPSLLTVIGFFIGGLLMTHLFLPFLIAS